MFDMWAKPEVNRWYSGFMRSFNVISVSYDIGKNIQYDSLDLYEKTRYQYLSEIE